MIYTQKWFDRKFDFSFSVELFPCILERLTGTPGRIEELVRSVPAERLILRPGDKWSIQEHVGHLLDLDELHEVRIADFLEGAKTLRPADLKNRKTFESNYNAQQIGAITRLFRERRSAFVDKLESMTTRELALTSVHPRLQQPMRLVDMAFFVAEHDDHHLAMMREVERKVNDGSC